MAWKSKSNNADIETEYCIVCGCPLNGVTLEKHHFPVPARHGGQNVIPICRTHHDAIDRYTLRTWDFNTVFRGWESMSIEGRLLALKLVTIAWEKIDADVRNGKTART